MARGLNSSTVALASGGKQGGRTGASNLELAKRAASLQALGAKRAESKPLIADRHASVDKMQSTNTIIRASSQIPMDGPPDTKSGPEEDPTKQSMMAESLNVSYKEMLGKMGHPLRGPVLQEFAVHYLFFLLVLFVAWSTEWAPQIRFYLAVLFFYIAIYCLNVSRLIFTRLSNSAIPFYISYIPLALLIYISREAHQIIMMLWFASFLIIFLQSGHPQLARHLLYFCAVHVCLYIVMLGVMAVSYQSNCNSANCSVALSTPISVLSEAILIIDCIFVMVIFYMLEKFINLNASTLLDRENYMQHLYIANMDLKRQLRNAKIENEVDLEAPLSRATQILQEVKEEQDLEPAIVEEIDFIIGLLSSDKLFQPDLFQNSNDADVHDWLKDMLLTDKASAKPANALPNPGEAGSITVDHVRLSPNELQQADAKAFELLDSHDDPEFDVFTLEEVSSGHALYFLGWFLFREHGFADQLNVDETKFRNWLIRIESGYRRSNTYHNSTHAADVTHSMNYFATRPQIWSTLKPEERFAVLVAPIVHDYMHPGVNNAFLIATSNTLALRYNDQSVLEHFHCASLFELLAQPELDILSTFTLDQRKTFREMVTSMVLATDMAFHFDWIGKFKTKLNGAGFNFENKPDKKMVLNIAIKCSDVNNPTKPQIASRKWTHLIMEEFFGQGDEEKRRGLPISTFMNRESTDIPKCQIGFIDFIVFPLYESWSNFMKDDVKVHMDNIQANKAFWKSCGDNPSLATPPPITVVNVIPASALMTTTKAPEPLPNSIGTLRRRSSAAARSVSEISSTSKLADGTEPVVVAHLPQLLSISPLAESTTQGNLQSKLNESSPGVQHSGAAAGTQDASLSAAPGQLPNAIDEPHSRRSTDVLSAPIQPLDPAPISAAVPPSAPVQQQNHDSAVNSTTVPASTTTHSIHHLSESQSGALSATNAPIQSPLPTLINMPVNPHGKNALPPVAGGIVRTHLKDEIQIERSPLDRPSLPTRVGSSNMLLNRQGTETSGSAKESKPQ
eukprot:jgi/Hompol1/897/HPOL_005453-RA